MEVLWVECNVWNLICCHSERDRSRLVKDDLLCNKRKKQKKPKAFNN